MSGKSDTIDAEHAARQVLSGARMAQPKTADGQIEALRLIKIARDTAVKARTTAMITLKETLVTAGDELKLVWPQPGIDPAELESWNFTHRLLQPMDGPEGATEAAMELVMRRPTWRLSLQMHKMLGIR